MEEESLEFSSRFNEKYSLVSRKMIRMLSENSRLTSTEIAGRLGISRQAVAKRLSRLEKEFGIRYVPEFNEDKLGISNPHIVMVKFREKPSQSYLADIFSRSYITQVVVSVKGTYDLLIYANSLSRDAYIHWDKGMQILLADYEPSWRSSDIGHAQLGFYPLRNDLLGRVSIPEEYKTILKALNTDARASFESISKQSGMRVNRVVYNFKKLLKLGYIKRFTLAMTKLENAVIMTHFAKYNISRTFENDAKGTRPVYRADDQYPLVSRYIITNQLVGSYDFFSAGVFDSPEVAYKRNIAWFRHQLKPERPKLVYGIVDKVIVGNLPVRSVDTYKEYDAIVWSPDFRKEEHL